MKLMTVEQRAALDAALADQNPAAPELVATTVAGVLHRGTSTASPIGRVFAGDVRALAARLLAVEDELAATRRTVARHVAAADAGNDPIPSDLLTDLHHAGHPLDEADLDAARDFHKAQAVMW